MTFLDKQKTECENENNRFSILIECKTMRMIRD